MFEKAFSIETFISPVWEFQAGLSHFLLRQYDQAVSRFLKTIERSSHFLHLYSYLACTYVELDRFDDARSTIKKALEITPQFTLKEAARLYPYRIDEDRDRILDSLRKAGLPEG